MLSQRPKLQVVARASSSEADAVAFSVMEYIDTYYPQVWLQLPKTARVGIRNQIVKAVMTAERKAS